MCTDLNGLVYVDHDHHIQVLDPRKNYKTVQMIDYDHESFDRLCFDDKNILIIVDNQMKQLNIFD